MRRQYETCSFTKKGWFSRYCPQQVESDPLNSGNDPEENGFRHRIIVNVGMGEMRISRFQEEILTTYSLGSCIGVCFHDPVMKIGGMIHCLLPLSTADPVKARENPAIYVDTGVTNLLQGLYNKGGARDRLVIFVAGAANIMDQNGFFKIGERNYTVVRKILWKNNILIHREDIGGDIPRTMSLDIATGKVFIRAANQLYEL